MQCKHHPGRKADHICISCNAPICSECTEEIKQGSYACFQCAMLHSVSEVGSDLLDKHDQAVEKKIRQKKKWGPFQFFLIVSSVLVLVMWGVIIFGGQAAPKGTVEFAKKGRVLLFMVNGALARYARYEGNKYPETLLSTLTH